jgi:cytochrome P450
MVRALGASTGQARPGRLGHNRKHACFADHVFPIGAAVTLEDLDLDPHPHLTRLREREPVSWLPALNGWLVTRHDLALRVMRDAATFTVDDPRFSTGQVIGPSMLSLDGEEHVRHRAPFTAPFRPGAVGDRFSAAVDAVAERLIESFASDGHAELRSAFAGPLAASIIARALGLGAAESGRVLTWYTEIVAAVTEITAGRGIPAAGRAAFGELRGRLEEVVQTGGPDSLLGAAAADTELTSDQIVANAAVLLFGGIETTEGMIANAALALLERPGRIAQVGGDPKLLDAAIDESLRLEPAAAVIDRYATAGLELERAVIGRGELVRVSISAANRDPAVFADPDRFELGRANGRRHIAFAQGPHVCLGVHLARLEARAGLAALLARLPGLRLDPARPSAVRGLVFRKPPTLHVIWG